MRTALVVGAGIFGVSAACELAARGWAVTVLAPAPIPNPLAATNDVSKAIRADYGADAFYTRLALDAESEWRADPAYRRTGVLFLRDSPLEPGGYEADSRAALAEAGIVVAPLDAATIAAEHAGFRGQTHGYFNPFGGWAASGLILARRWKQARAQGVEFHDGEMARLLEQGSRITGVVTTGGARLEAQRVIVAAGAATPWLLPELAEVMWATAHPVLLLRPDEPPHLPSIWAANIAETGLYGFPTLPDGTVKVAVHADGRRLAPFAPDESPDAATEAAIRARLAPVRPDLAGAPRIGGRWCRYSDTLDGDLWIGADPERPNLVVAAGGSGHGFKFAPMLGRWIADAVERKPNPVFARFGWRSPAPGREAARAGTRTPR